MHWTLQDRFCLRVFELYRIYLGLRLQVESEPAAIEKAHQFTYSIFDQSGFYSSGKQPKPMAEDERETSFGIAYRRNQLAGAIELATSTDRFSVERFFHVDFPDSIDREDVVEISRFAIAPEFRKRNATVAILLLLHALNFTRNRGARYWIGCSSGWLMQGFRSFFGKWTILEQKQLTQDQMDYRVGREGFFSDSLDVQVYLIDTHTISIAKIGNDIFKRYFRWKRWRKLASVNRASTRS